RVISLRVPSRADIPEHGSAPAAGLADHVIIGGYGLAGRYLRKVLANFDIPYVIVDMNPITVAEAEAGGLPIIYGDLSHTHVLRHAGVERARVMVLAVNDPPVLVRIVNRAKLANPALEIIVRAPYVVDIDGLVDAGAHIVVTEELESAVHLIEYALLACGLHREEAQRQLERLRAETELT
ncbi:MAG: NAD-binding protein, partial [Acidimicrobiia bacterium]|nr:NAD-binding protein [Acidimicrobiia bacterium]